MLSAGCCLRESGTLTATSEGERRSPHRHPRLQAKVRAVLASDFGRSSASLWAATPEDARAGLMANDEIYPYVSYNIMVA